jgi:hypothetical protein
LQYITHHHLHLPLSVPLLCPTSSSAAFIEKWREEKLSQFARRSTNQHPFPLSNLRIASAKPFAAARPFPNLRRGRTSYIHFSSLLFLTLLLPHLTVVIITFLPTSPFSSPPISFNLLSWAKIDGRRLADGRNDEFGDGQR